MKEMGSLQRSQVTRVGTPFGGAGWDATEAGGGGGGESSSGAGRLAGTVDDDCTEGGPTWKIGECAGSSAVIGGGDVGECGRVGGTGLAEAGRETSMDISAAEATGENRWKVGRQTNGAYVYVSARVCFVAGP
jgi:hypothetical protein